MERPLTLRPLSIQDENSAIPHRKVAVDGKSKSTKPIAKKGGAVLETRKALNDITNNKSTRVEASTLQKTLRNKKPTVVLGANVPLKGKNSIIEEVNIAEEGFLHDHNKCIETQKAELELNFLDTVFPGKGTLDLIMDQQKSRPDTDSYPELKELSMSGFHDLLDLQWQSPPTSPVRWGSPPRSLFAWDVEPVALMLKEEDF